MLMLALLMAAQESPSEKYVDFGSCELLALAGIADYSSDFEADAEMAGALLIRAPSPWLSGLLGLKETIGVWAEAGTTRIDRDLDPRLDDLEGAPMFFGAGLDYDLALKDSWVIRPQVNFSGGGDWILMALVGVSIRF